MHVVCRNCSHRIPVAYRPDGSTRLSNVRTEGNVSIKGGKIAFGPGGKISFGKHGAISFGQPRPSTFACPKCGCTYEYQPEEIQED
jgi:DNA-directed RNA polymerase subunit RPC12/RpoP